MRRFVQICLILVLCGCGLLGEKEPPTATLKADTSLGSCNFPSKDDLTEPGRASVERLRAAIDCAAQKVDQAFDKVQGATPGELTVAELRTLHRQKILDLPSELGDYWDDIGQVLPLFHPANRPALHRTHIKEILAWAWKHAPKVVRAQKIDYRNKDLDWLVVDETIQSIDELLELLSSRFSLSFSQARATLAKIRDKHPRTVSEDALSTLEAAWILKSLILEDKNGAGIYSDLRSDGAIQVIRLGLESFRQSRETFHWGAREALPHAIPTALPQEWGKIATIWKRYFDEGSFAPIESQRLDWALKQLNPRSTLSQLAGDIVRVTQRLSPRDRVYGGLHPVGIAPLLDEAARVAADLVAIREAFPACETAYQCRLPLRVASAHPILSKVAFKGGVNYWMYSDDSKPVPEKRLDYPLQWEQTAVRLVHRRLFHRVFQAFDRNHDGLIPLEGQKMEELEETFDLAYTFLRFIAVENRKPQKEGEKEEQLPQLVVVKPGPLYKVLGLIGDRWMPDGNRDKALDAEEFFSVLKVYEDIQERARSASYSLGSAKRYLRLKDWTPYFSYADTVFSRHEYIRALGRSLGRVFPSLREELKSVPSLTHESLYHALIGLPNRDSIEVREQGPPSASETDAIKTLHHYVSDSDSLGPAAIFNVLDRLMVLCDRNEDDKLDWRELDCAVPLVLDGAFQTVNSSLIELDPGTFDGARVMLSFLQMPGMPLTLAKLIVANGSIKDFRLEKEMGEIANWADTDMIATFDDLARFVGAPLEATPAAFAAWRLEARRRFGGCDKAPQDGKIQGKEEVSCLALEVLKRVAMTAAKVFGGELTPVAEAQLKELEASQIVRLGVALATQAPGVLDPIFQTYKLTAAPRKILFILEEIIRRGRPLGEIPE